MSAMNSHMHGCAQDQAAYAAGEKAALMRAFQMTLPSQQVPPATFHCNSALRARAGTPPHVSIVGAYCPGSLSQKPF